MKKSRLMVLAMAMVASAWVSAALRPAAAAPRDANQAWATAWATSQQGLGMAKISNATIRMIARVTLPGDSVRIASTIHSGPRRSSSARPRSGCAAAVRRSPSECSSP